MTVFDRIVIGGGISGLLAASRAQSLGERVAVLERGPLAGGVLQPTRIGGVEIDAGAEAFSTVGDGVRRLLIELGLGDDIVDPQRADPRIVQSASLRYRIPHGVLGIPANLDDPELLGIVSPHALAEAKRRDAEPPGSFSSMTVADVVENRLGREFVDKLVDPMFAGVHGSSATVLDAASTIPAVMRALEQAGSLTAAVASVRASQPRPGSAVASVRGGMHRLTDRLTEKLHSGGVPVLIDTRVDRVEQREDTWIVSSHDETFTTRSLTLAAGIAHASSILAPLGFDDEMQLTQTAVDVALALLLVDSEELNDYPLGSGALIAEASGCSAKATTHVNAKWEWVQKQLPANRHILRLSFGRNGKLPHGDLVELAGAEVSEIYSVSDMSIVESQLITWPQSLSQPTPEARETTSRLQRVASAHNIELCGSFVTGNGLLGIINDHYQRKAA